MTEQEINKIAGMMEIYKQNSEYITIKFKEGISKVDRIAYGLTTHEYYRLDIGERKKKTLVSIFKTGLSWEDYYSVSDQISEEKQRILNLLIKVTCILLSACSEHLFMPIPNPVNL